VFILPIHGPIDKAMLFIFRRAFRQARTVAPAAVILTSTRRAAACRRQRRSSRGCAR